MRVIILASSMALAMVTAAQAHPSRPATALSGERLYIARIIDQESDRDDRLLPARLVYAIKIVDIDHDGVADYQVDYNKVIHTHWCGDGGCNFELWRGTRNGHPVRVWNQIVRKFKLAQRNGETVFDFDFHGAYCGTFGSEACPASFAWDRAAGRLVERPTANGSTTVRLIEPLALTWAQVPAAITAAAHAASALCKAQGHDDEPLEPASIPDINGDGLRDWSLPTSVCTKPGQFETQQIIFATAGNAEQPIIAAAGGLFSVSVATKPATVARINQTESCGGFNPDGKICTQSPLRWNARTKQLEPATP